MIYFVYGEEKYLVEQKVNQIIKQEKLLEEPVFFNVEAKLAAVIDEIVTFGLFNRKKVVVLQNFYLLQKSEATEIKVLIQNLQLKPKETIVIFVWPMSINNHKNALITFLTNHATCFEFAFLSDKELKLYVKSWLKEKQAMMSDANIHYFLAKIPHQLIFVVNELEKLALYTKQIERFVIDDFVTKYEINKAFDFINAFYEQDLERLFRIYYEKLNQGENIHGLIGQITNTLEICSQIYSYQKQGYRNERIAKELNKHPFVIKKNADLLHLISYENVKFYLLQLAHLDQQIKTNQIDEKIGFEHFLLNLVQRQ